ncbi:MAG: YbjQ family protein [Planctomycetota bacterium]
MIYSSADGVPGRRIVATLGLVRGSSIRAAHLGQDITAWLKNLVGGELDEYTKMMAEAREQALDRVGDQARSLGADAVVAIRFSTSHIATGAAEILVYGTAVKLAPERAGRGGEAATNGGAD